MLSQPLTLPTELRVSVPTEHPEITWARKTLEAFPGTHFYMPKWYAREVGSIVECKPCALGWLAYALTGEIDDTNACKMRAKYEALLNEQEFSMLIHWGEPPGWRYQNDRLLPEFAAHPREAVPKAVFIRAFNMVARGERITAL